MSPRTDAHPWLAAPHLRIAGLGVGLLLCLLTRGVDAQVPGSAVVLIPNPEQNETVIHLNTREWLRGRVEYLNYNRLYFNSRKLDRVNFDWDDVHYFHTTESYEYFFRNDTKVRGIGRVDKETLYLTLPDGTERQYPRSDLIAIYPGEQGFYKARWFGKIGGSYDTTSGNTEETTFDANLDATRRAGSLEMRFRGNTSFSEAEGDENRRKHNLVVQTNYDLNHLFFWVVERGEATYDKFQNIDLRIRGSVGLGLNIFRRSGLNWTFEGGPGYEYTKFREQDVGGRSSEDSSGFYTATRFFWEITDDLDLQVTGDTFVSAENSDDATYTVRSTLSYELMSDFDIDFTVNYDRNENPRRDASGNIPDRDDVRFLIGLSWVF